MCSPERSTLAALEGLERGPAGNTSLAAAFAIAQEMDNDRIVVVQETEYTGAGKHPLAQLNLARQMGIGLMRGDPRQNVPGRRIVIPEHPAQIRVEEVKLDRVRRSYIGNAMATLPRGASLEDADRAFLAAETRMTTAYVDEVLDEMRRKGR
jgi:hypothetical protein